MNPAIGLIETLGLVALLNAVDAALKAANVKTISGVLKLDGGIVAVVISGDVSSVRAAVEAAAEAASRLGELKTMPCCLSSWEQPRRENPSRQPRFHQLQIQAF